MLNLDLPIAPYWLTVLPGSPEKEQKAEDATPRLAFKVKPCTKLVQGAARSYQRRMMEKLREKNEGYDAIGVETPEEVDLQDEDVANGVAELLFAQGLGRQGIVAIKGTAVDLPEGQDEGVPTPDEIDAIMRTPYIADLFTVNYQRVLTDLLTEGNG